MKEGGAGKQALEQKASAGPTVREIGEHFDIASPNGVMCHLKALEKKGMISREQLKRALQEQKQNGTRLGYNLVKLGFIAEVELTKMLAKQFKMPAVDLSRFEVYPKIAKMIPSDLATKNLVLPLKRDGRTLTVAMADPTNLGVLDDLKFITRYDIFPVLAGEYTLHSIIDKIYGTPEDQQLSALMELITPPAGSSPAATPPGC